MIARILFASVALALLPAAAATCESLRKLSLPDTTITTADLVSGGSFKAPGVPQAIANLPSVCRVVGTIRPSKDSDIQFEVWMPASGWNGKFFGVGNGGFAGAISYTGLASAIRESYAAASTDTGHQLDGDDASWALNHPEKIVDFGYRATHETAVKSKAVVREFYSDKPKQSYFSSCSNGGRQALMEAQRYPEDYDASSLAIRPAIGRICCQWRHPMYTRR